MSVKEKKIVPLGLKLGYTIGSIGDSTAYNIVISFLSFYLTTIAGISPAIAGNGSDSWGYGGSVKK